MVVIFGGYIISGKKKLGVQLAENLELVQSYQIFFFMLPIWFQRRIMLYNFSQKKYYELDDKLEDRLLKLGKNSTLEQLKLTIKQYEKEQHKKQEYYELHKKEINEKEDEEFMKFLKWAGILIGLVVLLVIIRAIFF